MEKISPFVKVSFECKFNIVCGLGTCYMDLYTSVWKHLCYIWFLKSIKEKKLRKMIFYVWFYYKKYGRKSNIIKMYIFLNYLIFT